MPGWVWILLAVVVAVAIIVAIVTLSSSSRRRTERLKEHYGAEYDRTLSETGDEKAANKLLAERERRRAELDIRPLSAEALHAYVTRWRAVQTAFVDHPASAVAEADILVTEVMRERGYPVDDFERRAADISVDHPTVVDHYRAAHDVHVAQHHGDVGTEQRRRAFVHYRALFEKLLEAETNQQEASA